MRISAIIPTWCEAACIGEAVAGARRVAEEVIVADAGSPDGTARIAREHGARVVHSPKGRGPQLRAGADAAAGDVLLFLHADALLAAGAREALLRRLEDPAIVGGNFLLRFAGPGPLAAAFSLLNDLRRRWLRIYYGDSAIFVRRSVYDQLGGFEPYPIFEDYEFVRRLERHGRTAYIRDVVVEVSSRRHEQAPWTTLASWVALHTLYSVGGVHPERLVALYRDVRAHMHTPEGRA
jgi:rSAM/selenodomain-associated transferase 2